MKSEILIVLMLLALTIPKTASADRLGEDVYPSDIELYEAYLLGDIEYETYLKLKDLYQVGIDSTDLYLIEEIPNISYFRNNYVDQYTAADSEKITPYLEPEPDGEPSRIQGSVRWIRYQKLEQNGDYENRLNFNTYYGENWKFALRSREEFDGRKEILSRFLEYRSPYGGIRKFIVGNYTARFGLGLNVGYRGKLFNKDEITTEETGLFPDYGGYNGLYIEGGERNQGARGMFHIDQDSTHRVQAAGVDLMREFGRFRSEFILVGARLEKRVSEKDLTHYQFGTMLGYRTSDFDIAFEITMPKGSRNFIPAFVTEAEYDLPPVNLQISGWRYADDFRNLFGGSRAGEIYRSYEIEEVDLTISDRRIGQSGFLIRNKLGIDRENNFTFALSRYGHDDYNNTVEMMAGYDLKTDHGRTYRLYYEYDRHKEGVTAETSQKVRAELRQRNGIFSIRSYLGYRRDRSRNDYLSGFSRFGIRSERFGRIDLWLNLSRFNLESGRIDYFYGYVKESVTVTEYMNFSVKVTYRYNRDYNDREDITAALETELRW